MTNDLILAGGTVVDPASGRHEPADIAVHDGRITEVGPALARSPESTVIDVSGKLVLPGLIDVHAHVFLNAHDLGPETDDRCAASGVTTIVDAGSAGSATFPGLRAYVAARSQVRLRCFVHLSAIGLMNPLSVGELLQIQNADPEGCARTIRENPGLAIGVKLRFSNRVVPDGSGDETLRLARQAADLAMVPLMIHVTDSPLPMPRILEFMRPGDIITHCFHRYSYGIMGPEQREILPEVWEAQRNGVLFDSAHGRMHFNFDFARRAIDQGFLPNTISTDLTLFTATQGPVFDLPTTMSKFLNFGVSLDEVVRRVTVNPAKVIGEEGRLGTLTPGAVADIAVFDLADGEFDFVDTDGQHFTGQQKLNPEMTIKDGKVWWKSEE